MPSIPQLQQLESLDPEDPFLPYALAIEHDKAGEYDQAVAAFDRCLALDPTYLYAYFHKARSLEAAGRVELAVEALQSGKAKAASDAKALGEITAYLDSLSP